MSKEGEKIAKEINEVIDNENKIDAEHLDVIEKELEPEVKPNIKGHELLVEKVKSTREKAESKHKEYLDATSQLEETTKAFIEQENKIVDTTVADSLELLNSLNVGSLADANKNIAQIEHDNKESLIKIKNPSKGTAKGLFWGILGAAATTAGALLYGAKLTNLPLNIPTFMQKVNLDTIATKYSQLLHIKDNPIVGYSAVAVASLIVGFLIYKIVKWIQANRNIKYTKKVEKDVENFTQNLDNKIEDIYSLKEHTQNIQSVMQKYDIILQEQNAKIRRIKFIEQPEDNIDSLQKKSKLEIEKTVLILDELLELMNTPVNNGVKIREESKNRLSEANSVINEVIKKLYI